MTDYFKDGSLPSDDEAARQLVIQSPLFNLVDGILYYVSSKQGGRCIVPNHMKEVILKENHGGPMTQHFAGEKLYRVLACHW